MALPLPTIQSVTEGAEFGRTVWPFIPQLLSLPASLIEAGTDLDSLKEVYLATNPFVTAIAFSLFVVPIFVIISEFNRNYSQVDRFWGILPTVYNAHYALWVHMAGLPTEKVNTVAIFSAIWSARLTFNYWRKGGYKIGSEDYRWEIVRSQVPSRAVFFIFNVLFISFAQSLLLSLITAPTYTFVALSRLPEGSTFGIPDLVFSRLLVFFVIIEFFADQQQWKFHQAKHSYQETARIPDDYKGQFTAEDLDRGFVVSGLWSLCRHPNFAAEQAIWLTLYLWDCWCTETYVNWTGAGALGYLLLFQGSTQLTESISAGKYPEYKEYQARVGRFIPRFSVEPRGDWKSTAEQSTSAGSSDEEKRDQATSSGTKSSRAGTDKENRKRK